MKKTSPSQMKNAHNSKSPRVVKRVDPKIRLQSKIDIAESGCWNIKGATNQSGYGLFYFRDQQMLAHRASWILFKGEIPIGMYVLHACDNPRCCNPDHLFLGTNKDNMQDMMQKGRGNKVRGSKIGTAKLTEPQVAEIKRMLATSQLSQQSIAEIFNVSQVTISLISRGKYWKHV